MADPINAKQLVGTHDVVLITLDALRYDVAERAMRDGDTPNLAGLLPGGAWEPRHTPANFTYAAHQAFFAGFLPTPIAPGRHGRLFAVAFPGSETTTSCTCVFDAQDIVRGFASRDYHTVCIGGVGFFNRLSPLGSVLPALFEESRWSEEMGVTSRHSTELQVQCALDLLARLDRRRRLFLFMNISATHQPTCIFVDGAIEESVATQQAALAYVDACLPPLVAALQRRAPLLCIVCSDHGTAYGEDGYWGHRHNHPIVLTVPYAEFVLPRAAT